jgi:hypothetical protein
VATALTLLAAGLFLAMQAIGFGAEGLSPAYSQKSLADQVAASSTPELPFYSIQDYPQSLPFYLGRTLTLVAYEGELEFGIGQEPDKWIPNLKLFAAQWRADKQALAVMPADAYDALVQEGLPMTVIGRDPQHVAVRKP